MPAGPVELHLDGRNEHANPRVPPTRASGQRDSIFRLGPKLRKSKVIAIGGCQLAARPGRQRIFQSNQSFAPGEAGKPVAITSSEASTVR